MCSFSPYYSKIQPVESNFVSAVTYGEGWHNFHHTFPKDYRASEYGQKHDLSTTLIEGMKKLGWAYDLNETPQHIVNNWVKKFGDGNHPLSWEEENATDNTEDPSIKNKILNSKN
jgi:stearoyl-CoA desaturase (delta-9 desaturase)